MMIRESHRLFKTNFPIIGVVHLLPLPGSPGFKGSIKEIMGRALSDVEALLEGGVDGIIVENFGDAPFPKNHIPDESLSLFSIIAHEIRKILPEDFPLGINVLRNCTTQAVILAYNVNANFIRINIPVGAFLTPSGIIESQIREAALKRKELGAEKIYFFEDVMVKHAWPITDEKEIEGWVKETEERGLADVLIVSGRHTGEEVDVEHLKRVKTFSRKPVIIGSGLNEKNVEILIGYADGAIVGTFFEKDMIPGNPVEQWKVARLMEKVKTLRR